MRDARGGRPAYGHWDQGTGKEEGVVRRSTYGGLVIVASVALAFVAVMLTVAGNH